MRRRGELGPGGVGPLCILCTEGRDFAAETRASMDGVMSASSAVLFRSGDERVAIRSVGALNGVHPRGLSRPSPFWVSPILLSVLRSPNPNKRRFPSSGSFVLDRPSLTVCSLSVRNSELERLVSPARSDSWMFRIFWKDLLCVAEGGEFCSRSGRVEFILWVLLIRATAAIYAVENEYAGNVANTRRDLNRHAPAECVIFRRVQMRKR